ncbi:TetR/AcrR family transcriptional regulator [Cellulomonas sp. URHB0016]
MRLHPDARRETILAAARTVFSKQPFDQVSVASVAAAAGASEALLYRYFRNKADLYAQLVREVTDELLDHRDRALAALPPGVSARDQVRATLLVYLEHPAGWVGTPLGATAEPEEAVAVRREARAAWVEGVRAVLLPDQGLRHEFALWGFLGFLESTCRHWEDAGRPEEQLWSLVDACLGALEGALGDWGR